MLLSYRVEVVEAISRTMKLSDEDIKAVKEEKVRKNGFYKNKILLRRIIMECTF